MKLLSDILHQSRLESGKKIIDVSADLDIDKGLLSKYENGKRPVSKETLYKFISYYSLNENDTVTAWLTDKIIYEIGDEALALNAMKVAEDIIRYHKKSNNDNEELNEVLSEIDNLKSKWLSCKPLDEIQLKKMQEYFDLNFTYNSNKIEGNTLTMQETFLVIRDGLTVGGKSLNEHLEAINHAEALEYIIELVTNKEVLTEKILQEIHYLILKGIDRKNAGKYRSVPVIISGSSHVPPQPFLVPRQMEIVFEFYRDNHLTLHPVIMAAEMHERIVSVHPFIDGNGRTSRLIMNLILLMNGYTLAIIDGDASSRQEYYNALESVRLKNKDEFTKLICAYSKKSLEQHIELAG